MGNPEIMPWSEHKEREREQARTTLIDVAFEHPDGVGAWDIKKQAHARDCSAFYASSERQIEQQEWRRLESAGKPVPWGISKTAPDAALYGLALSSLIEEGTLARNAANLIVLKPELFNERLSSSVSG